MKKCKSYFLAAILLSAIFILKTNRVNADPWIKCMCTMGLCQWCNAGTSRSLCDGETQELFAVCYGQNCSSNPCYYSGTFQWYKLDFICKPIPGSNPPVCLWDWYPVAISGETSVSYEVTEAGTYWCEVNCGSGPYETDHVEYFYFSAAPEVSHQPESPENFCLGDEASFTVNAYDAYSYRWREKKYGGSWSNISGATSKTYTFTPDDTYDQAQFACVITNGCGNATSNPATLDINFAPSVTVHPESVDPCEETSTNFSISATGDGISYQWQRSENQGGSWINQNPSGKY